MIKLKQINTCGLTNNKTWGVNQLSNNKYRGYNHPENKRWTNCM